MSRFLFVILASATMFGATSAEAAARNFPIGGFSRIQSNVPFTVHVHTGAAPSARAQGPQDALDRLIVDVVNGELVIRSKPGSWWSAWNWHRERAFIDVTVPMLTAATLSGPGDLTIDQIRTRDFNATLRGPGDLTIDAIDTGDATLTLDGPGDLTVKGRAATAHITLRGPGDVRASGLTVRDATVNLTGPGDVALGATGVVNGALSGPGDIAIHGGARCQISKHGPGDVSCR
ncbi:head GIN domain-containing protein [Sphingomonas sp. MMS24-J13]|uniref:head GIN domain-containing protein n=1 Tax=Sphingomonas sp. MMS24-J13 TaxID=3238686 RepID=UPI00384F9D91